MGRHGGRRFLFTCAHTMSVREWHGDMQGNEAWAREAAQRCIRAGFGVLRVATQNWADVKREHPEWFQPLFREKQCRSINVSHGFTEVYLQVCTVSPSCHCIELSSGLSMICVYSFSFFLGLSVRSDVA